jgi:hypothetical protein
MSQLRLLSYASIRAQSCGQHALQIGAIGRFFFMVWVDRHGFISGSVRPMSSFNKMNSFNKRRQEIARPPARSEEVVL